MFCWRGVTPNVIPDSILGSKPSDSDSSTTTRRGDCAHDQPDASAPSSRPTTSPGSKPTDAYASYSPNSRPSPWRSSRQNCDQRPAPKGPTPDRDEKHRPPSASGKEAPVARKTVVLRPPLSDASWAAVSY